jgi:hypothetical protein
MNWFQRWLVDAVFQLFRKLRHIEHKIDLLNEHLGVTLPPELIKAVGEASKKSQALEAAIEANKDQAQAEQPTTKKEP